MGFLNWVVETFGYAPPAKGTVARLVERGLVNRPLTPYWDVKRFADEGYRRNVLVYACIKLRMRSAAQVKFVAKSENRNGDLEPLPLTHPLQKLLMRPNAEQSQREWIQQAWMHRDVGGAAVVHKVRARVGNPVELWLLRPDRVDPIPNEIGFVDTYEFPNDLPQRLRLPAEDVVYYRDQDYLDDYYGLSKIAVLARQGDVDNESAEYMRSVLLNAGMPAAALKIKEGTVAPEVKESLKKEWRTKYGRDTGSSSWSRGFSEFGAPSSAGWGGIAVLDADVEYIKMGSVFNEMNLDGIFQHTETRICAAFGVPPMLIGAKAGIDRSTYSNSEQAEDNFWNQTMVPECADFAEKLTMEVAPEFGEGLLVEPDYSAIRALQEDRDALVERTSKGWDAGVVQFDEYRMALDLEPVGEGALVLDEESGEEISALGKKYKWELPQAKVPAQPMEDEEPEEEEGEEEDPFEEETEEQDGITYSTLLRLREVLEKSYRRAEHYGKNASWRKLHQAADDKQLVMRRCVSKGFRLAQEGVEVQALANAIFVKDEMKAESLALQAFRDKGLPVIKSTLCKALGELYRSGAKVGARDLRRRQSAGPSEKFAPPDLDPGKDTDFAETRVGELVTDVTEATRQLIRRAVEGMFEEGYSARRAATRIRDNIGLTRPMLRRLQKFEERQRKRGIVGDALDKSLSRYSRKLIKERALTIARTEGIRAVSEGQSSIWEKAVSAGILPGDQEQFWITTEDERTCEICAPMDGQTVKVGEMFHTGNGGTVDAPPAHPNCRCARGLR